MIKYFKESNKYLLKEKIFEEKVDPNFNEDDHLLYFECENFNSDPYERHKC